MLKNSNFIFLQDQFFAKENTKLFWKYFGMFYFLEWNLQNEKLIIGQKCALKLPLMYPKV
jgi:hypothetical protein